jgi:hypothetical protein
MAVCHSALVLHSAVTGLERLRNVFDGYNSRSLVNGTRIVINVVEAALHRVVCLWNPVAIRLLPCTY